VTQPVIIGDATLYCGRAEDILPTLPKMDACVTDPPYGINKDGQKRTTGGNGGRKAYDFLGWDADRPDAAMFDLILKSAEHHIIWGGNYFADLLPASMKWLVWDKDQRINQSDGELAYTSMQGALRIFDMNRVALMTDGAEHPTQKPVQLMKWCILQLPRDCDLIIDPFMGSGTTGVAALGLGRKFIGIEREQQYFDIAVRRITAAHNEPQLFASTRDPSKPTQEPLL
jgi:DNA modification methylase